MRDYDIIRGMFTPIYRITDRIAKQISDIAQIKSFVDQATLLPAREAMLRRLAVVKMTHSSTSIEGNSLAQYQVKQVADGKKVRADAREIQEVNNYLQALKLIDSIANASTIKVSDVLRIQKKVIAGLIAPSNLGTFRQSSVFVVNILPNGKTEKVYTPPSNMRILKLIEELLTWLSVADNIHPVIRAGLFHYQFETIHPFTDGNGRTGRLLTLLHLYQSGWNFKKVLVLDDYYANNRKAYYQALQTGKTFADRKGVDLTGWLEYFVQGFWEESITLKEQLLSLQGGTGNITERRLDTDELKIIDFLVTMGKITSADVVDILSVPKRTAQDKLNRLEKYRVVKKVGAGPATYYTIADI